MQVTIIADSTSLQGIRLTTMHLRYWRPIHSELMTHRVFSRNARSSRAVPVITLLEEEMYIPYFMKNRPGMSATEEMSRVDRAKAEHIWEALANTTREAVIALRELGVHKQWANRPLEWFGYIDVLVTSTFWDNFWELRSDKEAQPEIRELAIEMLSAMKGSTPQILKPGEWHLPYITEEEQREHPLDMLLRLSTARCARLSYKPFDGNADIQSEEERFRRLILSRPVHSSPAEHQATPDRVKGGPFLPTTILDKSDFDHPEHWGNFHGWRQHRKLIPHEATMEY